jgi:hypothetical protein
MKDAVNKVRTNSKDRAGFAAVGDIPRFVDCKMIAVKRHYGLKNCSVLSFFQREERAVLLEREFVTSLCAAALIANDCA